MYNKCENNGIRKVTLALLGHILFLSSKLSHTHKTILFSKSFSILPAIRRCDSRSFTRNLLLISRSSKADTISIDEPEVSEPPSQLSTILQTQEIEINNHQNSTIHKVIDKRPHEQRTSKPRAARRLNHSFQHLYRHDSPDFDDRLLAHGSMVLSSAKQYLIEYGGFSDIEVDVMSREFPPLLDLDVVRHLRPKLRFLKYTLGGIDSHNSTASTTITTTQLSSSFDATNQNQQLDHHHHHQQQQQQPPPQEGQNIHYLSSIAKQIPPSYFGARLEKTVAPRHAFLMYMNLPHGHLLLENNATLFQDFLIACRKPKAFCNLCNEWMASYYGPDTISNNSNSTAADTHSVRNYDSSHHDEIRNNDEPEIESKTESIRNHKPKDWKLITTKDIETFDILFQRGTMAAARDEMYPQSSENNNHTNIITNTMHNTDTRDDPISSGQMIRLLTKHGANPLETDVRGISLLHWAAGSGNLDALLELVKSLPGGGGINEALKIQAQRDGATILHWAAAGAKSKEFGCGGHIHVCSFLLDQCLNTSVEKEVVNILTKDGNSVLMWAAWSRTIDVVKLLVRNRADVSIRNRNGCTVAHWAASGGDVEICKYLYETVGVDFSVENYAGNTPLSHAVAYGRLDVVRWLREDLSVDDSDDKAKELALDFLDWGKGDAERRKVFDLFGSHWYDN